MKRSLKWHWVAALIASGLIGGSAQAEEGLHAGIDLLFLAPKFSSLNLPSVFYGHGDGLGNIESTAGSTTSELEFAQRVIIGYEGDQGGGVQVRWFSFDNDVTYTGDIEHDIDGPVTVTGIVNVDVDAIDAEFTQRGQFRVWDWVATGGVRYAKVSVREDLANGIDFDGFSDSVWAGSTGVEFEGAGPTVSVEGSRPILIDGLSFFSRARTALLYGDIEQYSAWRVGGLVSIPDEFVQVWEIQTGLEMEREYDSFDLLLGIFWEAQIWDSELLGDLAFHGFGVHTGIEY